MKTDTYSLTWDLDVFFKGGSESEELAVYLEGLKKSLEITSEKITNFSIPVSSEETEGFKAIMDSVTEQAEQLSESGAFIGCLQAQNTLDKKAQLLEGTAVELYSIFENNVTALQLKFKEIQDPVWEELVTTDALKEISFVLNEMRVEAMEKLSIEEENLITMLAKDGYHSWGQMYDTVVGKMKMEYDGKELSMGQASNLFSSKDRQTRQETFEKWENTWAEQGDYFAKILNHLAGFRSSTYQARGWDDFLKEALKVNRMSKETLDAMWGAVSNHKSPFVEYLNRKAKLLGVEKLSWSDLDAPIGESNSKMSYQEGADFILEQFGSFGKKLTSFTEHAFENGWIEAEDRPNKRPGGFCTGMPVSKESRIFMTYSGTPSNVSTLAHEIGHAFHSHTMKDMHSLNTNYGMNVAETASTFAEMIVADAAVKVAKTEDERLALLEDKIQRSVAFFMNIHARFLFETRFYEERQKGMVSEERLSQLMEEAQKEGYCDALSEYHPHFWASKLHFYITGVPFYNFPYTFGYLFSLGIYARALEDGEGYEEKYIALLKDAGSMTVEQLAAKHLDVDLTKPHFWENAVKLAVRDVEEFLALTE